MSVKRPDHSWSAGCNPPTGADVPLLPGGAPPRGGTPDMLLLLRFRVRRDLLDRDPVELLGEGLRRLGRLGWVLVRQTEIPRVEGRP